MNALLTVLEGAFPDGIIYGLIVLVFLFGAFKCCGPVLRNAGALRHATDLLGEGAKIKLGRAVYTDASFLGKRLRPVWQAFLQSAEVGQASGISADVAEYVHDDNIIHDPGKATLAEVIPGLCTSLGILGTFIGLSMGLSGLDMMDATSIVQLTSGIAFAFNTSIAGIVASIFFNILYRISTGRARKALDNFIRAFYQYGISKPPDAQAQLLSYEREQADAMLQFSQDLSQRMGSEIQRGIAAAMRPMQKSMEDFMHVATRAQVEGLDYIVARFIDRMNSALGGELGSLRAALTESKTAQGQADEKLRATVEAIGGLGREVTELHGISEQIIARLAEYVGSMGDAYRQVDQSQRDAADVLEEISEAALRQAKYLSALQEYQASLQESFQTYTLWTDQYISGLDARTNAQTASLAEIAAQMRESAGLLQGSYKTFTEAVALGMQNSVGIVGENLGTLMGRVQDTIGKLNKSIEALNQVLGSEGGEVR